MHHREYVRATGINLLFTFCIYLYYPILAPYIKSMGLDDFQTALVFSILPLVMIFSSPIMGRLADNVGRIRVIILGLILEIIAMILYIVSVNISLIIIARVLDAVAIAGVILVAIAKIEDSLSEKERGKYAGWSLSLAQIGAIIGPIVGGLMADKLFVRAPFMLTAVILLVMAFMLASKTSKLKKKVERKNFNWLAEIKHFLSIKELRGMAILGVVMHASIPATQVFLPLFIIERLGLSYTYVGIAIFFFGVMHLFQFYFGSLSNK
ncbi:MFS transporter, partial [Candidatus Woesearchaeota archaeon]|nr:MFS transporter [Candidatus Woesearchaeota archaeon]